MPFSRRRSLAFKIPLLMSMILLMAMAATSLASYVELRRVLIDLSAERLREATDQMAVVLSQSPIQRTAAMRQLMARREVREALRTGATTVSPALEAAFRSYLGQASAIASVELWDPSGKSLAAVGAAFEPLTGPLLAEHIRDFPPANQAAIGRLRMFDDGLRYPLGGTVAEGDKVIGYVVERRRVTNPSQVRQTVQLLTRLIGRESTMIIGNADGTLWSDLESPVADVPFVGGERRLWEYRRAGRPELLAWASPVNATPWAVAIEFPRDTVLAPLQRLMLRSLVISAILLGLATAAGWWLLRRITTPLVRVTEAAEAVADSQKRVFVEVDREDEVGRLADSFYKMAQRVEQSRVDLELRVEQRTAELSAANRELEAFSYTVSHDLRAPLRAIAGFVQILDEDHSGQFDAEARKHLERVKVNARRMGQLIDDLLSFSQIGRATISRQTVDLHAMARAIGEEAVATADSKIELTVDTLPPCFGAPALLNQVLVNLISNAVKFSARVAHPAIHIGCTTDAGETIYFVRDNGVGFDERYAEKLFGVFQRLHRVDDFEGTGVGLAIVHRIISRHGGRVWAQGKVNQGATFYFTLPSYKKPA
jgi:signal transduction histidine kinase